MDPLLPAVSVVIPTHDRPRQLAECITAVAALDYPAEHLEIVVVRDGGAALPVEALASVGERARVTVIEQAQAGPAAARNAGCARAAGTLIAFTDDDCLPDRAWLRELVAGLAGAADAAVGGRTLNGLDADPYAAASQLIVDAGYEYFNPDPRRASFLATNNLALPADRLRALGGLDPALRTCEDRDLCDRWATRGWRLTYAPQAIVWHRHALTLPAFCRLHYRYGRGAWQFHRARALRSPNQARHPRAGPDPRFYRLLLGRASRSRQPSRMLPLVMLAQLATAAGVARERLDRRRG